MGADRLALWLSYRIGAAEAGGEALIRTGWAARRLSGTAGTGIAALIGDLLGDTGRGDVGFVADVVGALDGVAALVLSQSSKHSSGTRILFF